MKCSFVFCVLSLVKCSLRVVALDTKDSWSMCWKALRGSRKLLKKRAKALKYRPKKTVPLSTLLCRLTLPANAATPKASIPIIIKKGTLRVDCSLVYEELLLEEC